MSNRPTRRVQDVLEPLAGVVVTLVWVSVGVRVLVADDPAVVQGVVAGVVFAVAGVGLGVALGNLGGRRARRLGRTVPASGAEQLALSGPLLGTMSVGLGLQAVDPASTFATVAVPLFCLVGGATAGLFLVAATRRSAAAVGTSAPV